MRRGESEAVRVMMHISVKRREKEILKIMDNVEIVSGLTAEV